MPYNALGIWSGRGTPAGGKFYRDPKTGLRSDFAPAVYRGTGWDPFTGDPIDPTKAGKFQHSTGWNPFTVGAGDPTQAGKFPGWNPFTGDPIDPTQAGKFQHGPGTRRVSHFAPAVSSVPPPPNVIPQTLVNTRPTDAHRPDVARIAPIAPPSDPRIAPIAPPPRDPLPPQYQPWTSYYSPAQLNYSGSKPYLVPGTGLRTLLAGMDPVAATKLIDERFNQEFLGQKAALAARNRLLNDPMFIERTALGDPPEQILIDRLSQKPTSGFSIFAPPPYQPPAANSRDFDLLKNFISQPDTVALNGGSNRPTLNLWQPEGPSALMDGWISGDEIANRDLYRRTFPAAWAAGDPTKVPIETKLMYYDLPSRQGGKLAHDRASGGFGIGNLIAGGLMGAGLGLLGAPALLGLPSAVGNISKGNFLSAGLGLIPKPSIGSIINAIR